MNKVSILPLLIICITTIRTHAMEEKISKTITVYYHNQFNTITEKKPDFLKTIKTQANNLTDIQKAILAYDHKNLKKSLEQKQKPDITQNEAQHPVIKTYGGKHGSTPIIHHVLAPGLLEPIILAKILFEIRVELYTSHLSDFVGDGGFQVDEKSIEKIFRKSESEGKVLTLLENFNS